MVSAPGSRMSGAGEQGQRLFLAVTISDGVRSLIRGQVAERGLPGRLVQPGSWHITMRFLGVTPDNAARALAASLRETWFGPPFSITFGGLGAFPRPTRASVLWLGVESGAARLGELAAKVEQVVRSVGFPAADHPFRAHLTLSRLSPPADVRPSIERGLLIDEPMDVTEVVLFRSRLGRGPAVYEPVDRFPLVG